MKNLIVLLGIIIFLFGCEFQDESVTPNIGQGLEYGIKSSVFGLKDIQSPKWDNLVVLHKDISRTGFSKYKIGTLPMKEGGQEITFLKINSLVIPQGKKGGCHGIYKDEDFELLNNEPTLQIETDRGSGTFTNNLDIDFDDIADTYDKKSDFTIKWHGGTNCEEVFIWVKERDTFMKSKVGDTLGGKFYFIENNGELIVPKEVFQNFKYDMQLFIVVGKIIEQGDDAFILVTSKESKIITKAVE